MCSVELKKPMHPLAVMGSLIAVTAVSAALLYFGVPGTAFHGMKSGVFFPMDVEFDDARFMDNKIKCDSKEVTAEVLDVIAELRASAQPLILVTHEMGFARESADAVAFVAGGAVLECTPAREFFQQPRSETARRFLQRILKY